MYSRFTVRAALPILLATLGAVGAREASAQAGRGERVAVPVNTVVRVRLEDRVSSDTAKVGDRVRAVLAPSDHSGFPEATRFDGEVTDVQRTNKDRPGILDMRFKRVVFPDGKSETIDARLASLNDEDVRRTDDGRLETRKRDSKEKFDPKWVGYGAAGGAVLATILGGGFLKGALLGGVGGAIYAYLNKDKDKDRREYRDVRLERDTEFGLRLNTRVAFDGRGDYRYSRYEERPDGPRPDKVLGDRGEYRYSNAVINLDGKRVEFRELKPVNVNGRIFVPLATVADAAGLKYRHRDGDDSFTVITRDGEVRGTSGDSDITLRNRDTAHLDNSPMSIDGEIYVSTEFLSRALGMQVNWDRKAGKLDLESER